MIKLGLGFVFGAAAYLTFAGQVSLEECLAAGVSAIAATALSAIACRSSATRFHIISSMVARRIIAAVPQLVIDSLIVIPRLLSGRAGMTSQEHVGDDGNDRDPAWWAVFTLTTSLPPNSYVISRLARDGEIIIHRLEPRKG